MTVKAQADWTDADEDAYRDNDARNYKRCPIDGTWMVHEYGHIWGAIPANGGPRPMGIGWFWACSQCEHAERDPRKGLSK